MNDTWSETAVKRLQYFYYRLPPWMINSGLLLGLLLLFFNKMIFSNLILARGDTFLYFYPYWEMAAEALQAGRVPLWNPYIFMGAPFLANSQVGFFYPLNWPVWLLFETPYAVKTSIVLHIFIAAWGAYLAGERALGLERQGALLTAVLFAFGGYYTAQIEHINQMQGLAWLPWYLVMLTFAGDEKVSSTFIVVAKTAVGLTLLFSLQFLAGHTQTVFISIVLVLVWSIAKLLNYHLNVNTEDGLLFRFSYFRFRARIPFAFVIGGGLAGLVTAVQFLPTYQLSQLSSRFGGLTINEVLSFSLHPLLLTRSLLPAINQSLFTEYTAFVPGSALILAVIGGWQWRRWRGVTPAISLIAVGLFFGLGQFNPLNWLIMRLPGFNLFRVPARFMILYALGVALLAGLGWQIVQDRFLLRTLSWREVPERARETLWHMERPLRIGVYLLIGLILWSTIATILSVFVATGPEAPYEAPSLLTLLIWLLELGFVFLWLSGQRIRYDGSVRLKFVILPGRVRNPLWISLIMVGLLFWGSRTQPYHLNLTTPEAYFDIRPAVSRLQTAVSCQPSPSCNEIPGRILSLSNIQFDPGDMGELATIYDDQLTPIGWQDYIVAIKQKEIIGPNLAMTFGLATVDGFDGGVLPLRSYSELVADLIDGQVTTDGRLREYLTAVPEAEWLDRYNVQYVITDKTGDVWLDVTATQNAFFDMQHPVQLEAGQSVEVGHLPDFEANRLLIASAAQSSPVLTMQLASGNEQTVEAEQISDVLWQYSWEDIGALETAVLQAVDPLIIQGVSLFNSETGTFHALVLGQYRLIHSGDVKIYENLDVKPRVWVVSGATDATVEIQAFDFEAVSIRVVTDEETTLYFSDTYYPGWVATVDGTEVSIEQPDQLTRAIEIEAGTHDIRFFFDNQAFVVGRSLTIVGLVILGFLLLTFTVLAFNRSEYA
ncbi:MAG: hypothetical protein AAF490_21855 [Chloroflexota bacterium]